MNLDLCFLKVHDLCTEDVFMSQVMHIYPYLIYFLNTMSMVGFQLLTDDYKLTGFFPCIKLFCFEKWENVCNIFALLITWMCSYIFVSEQCQFGPLKLNIGDKLASEDDDDICRCDIPPQVSCFKKQWKLSQ